MVLSLTELEVAARTRVDARVSEADRTLIRFVVFRQVVQGVGQSILEL